MIFLKHLMSCGMGQQKAHPSFLLYAPLAQSVEHRPFKAGVLGSSPRRRTISLQETGCVRCLVSGSPDGWRCES